MTEMQCEKCGGYLEASGSLACTCSTSPVTESEPVERMQGDRQPFESYPEIVGHLLRMAETGRIGTCHEWNLFAGHLNDICAKLSSANAEIAAFKKERDDYRQELLRINTALDIMWNMPGISQKSADWVTKRVCEIQRYSAQILDRYAPIQSTKP
jgi:hypothetical protein